MAAALLTGRGSERRNPMARRQDSGSNSSHENQQPNAHNEDRLPEFTDNARGRADEDPDDMDVDDEDMEEGDEEEGTV
jgi:hypothetical protein